MREPSPFVAGNPERPSLRYLFLRFLRIGALAWGGPLAQIHLMHRELVERDGWATEEEFRKTLAVYQVIPGPEAQELAVWFGVRKRGRAGGLATGLAFLLPGTLLVLALAWAYVAYGVSEAADHPLLYGLKAAAVGLVAGAVVRLARRWVDRAELAAIVLLVVALDLLVPDLGFVPLLVLGGVLAFAAALARGEAALPIRAAPAALLPLALSSVALPVLTLSGAGAIAFLFLKAGFLTFGGAYTILPILEEDAILAHGWITHAQFADAAALAGVVPAPFVSVGAFVGYLVAGFPGAGIALACIYLPAFGLTLLGHRHLERLVRAPRLHIFLVGVTAAVVGLVAATAVALGQAALPDAPAAAIALAVAAVTIAGRGNVAFVMLAAGAAGYAWRVLAV